MDIKSPPPTFRLFGIDIDLSWLLPPAKVEDAPATQFPAAWGESTFKPAPPPGPVVINSLPTMQTSPEQLAAIREELTYLQETQEDLQKVVALAESDPQLQGVRDLLKGAAGQVSYEQMRLTKFLEQGYVPEGFDTKSMLTPLGRSVVSTARDAVNGLEWFKLDNDKLSAVESLSDSFKLAMGESLS